MCNDLQLEPVRHWTAQCSELPHFSSIPLCTFSSSVVSNVRKSSGVK